MSTKKKGTSNPIPEVGSEWIRRDQPHLPARDLLVRVTGLHFSPERGETLISLENVVSGRRSSVIASTFRQPSKFGPASDKGKAPDSEVADAPASIAESVGKLSNEDAQATIALLGRMVSAMESLVMLWGKSDSTKRGG